MNDWTPDDASGRSGNPSLEAVGAINRTKNG